MGIVESLLLLRISTAIKAEHNLGVWYSGIGIKIPSTFIKVVVVTTYADNQPPPKLLPSCGWKRDRVLGDRLKFNIGSLAENPAVYH